MRVLAILTAAAIAASSACGSTTPSSPQSAMLNPLTGTWVGNAADSSGSMMGSGAMASTMGGAQWTITQSGNSFSGTMRLTGYSGGTVRISGTLALRSGTFTMTMPTESMMGTGCSASATGSFDLDEAMVEFHGTYAGSNTCSGPFAGGQVTMRR
jgi:hypothetical protein